MKNKVESSESHYFKLLQELAFIKMFVQDLVSSKQLNKQFDDLQKKFETSLNLHEAFKENKNLDQMIETDSVSTQLLEIKTKYLLKEFLSYFAQDILDIIASDILDLEFLFIWEKRVMWDCFEGNGTQSKYCIPSSIIKYCTNTISQYSHVEKMNTSMDREPNFETLPFSVIENIEMEENNTKWLHLIELKEKWEKLIQNREIIQRKEYFTNANEIQSLQNLFALFSLFDDNLIIFTDDLGVKWNGN